MCASSRPYFTNIGEVIALGIFHKDPDVGEAVFKEFLPRALESGQVKPFPPSSVIGKGIDAIQGGVDRLRAGVSATKVIVAL